MACTKAACLSSGAAKLTGGGPALNKLTQAQTQCGGCLEPRGQHAGACAKRPHRRSVSERRIEFYVDVFADKQEEGVLGAYVSSVSARTAVKDDQSVVKKMREILRSLEIVGEDREVWRRRLSDQFEVEL